MPYSAIDAARKGESHLRYAVCRTLSGRTDGSALGAAEIGKQTGIFRESGWAKKSGNDDIAWGVLGSLVKDGLAVKAKQPNGKGGFILTAKGEATLAEHPWSQQ